jgi:hypothetical protein
VHSLGTFCMCGHMYHTGCNISLSLLLLTFNVLQMRRVGRRSGPSLFVVGSRSVRCSVQPVRTLQFHTFHVSLLMLLLLFWNTQHICVIPWPSRGTCELCAHTGPWNLRPPICIDYTCSSSCIVVSQPPSFWRSNESPPWRSDWSTLVACRLSSYNPISLNELSHGAATSDHNVFIIHVPEHSI